MTFDEAMNGFLDTTWSVSKENNLDFIKILKICVSELSLSKGEDNLQNGKIFTNHIWWDWWLEYIKNSTTQKDDPILKNGQGIWIDFFKENIGMTNKYMKLCLTSLVIKEMHLKLQWDNYFMPIRIATVEKRQ